MTPEADGTATTSVTYDRETGEFALRAPPQQALLQEETGGEMAVPAHVTGTDSSGERADRASREAVVVAQEYDVEAPAFARLLG